MREHPKSIRLRVPDYKQVANHKINALRVPHTRKIVRNSLQDILKDLFLLLFELKGAIEIFFDLREALMILHVGFQLMIRLVLSDTAIVDRIFGDRYLLFSVSNLKTQAFFIGVLRLVQTVEYVAPFVHQLRFYLLVRTHPLCHFYQIAILGLLQNL